MGLGHVAVSEQWCSAMQARLYLMRLCVMMWYALPHTSLVLLDDSAPKTCVIDDF